MSLKNNLPAMILVFILSIIGYNSSKDYGLAWDEPDMREIGYLDYNYVTGQKDNKGPNTFYGSVVELTLVFAENHLGVKTSSEAYILRHRLCHLFFLFSGYFLYILLLKVLHNRMLSIGFMMVYLLFPLFYGHSFFNSKDIPFLAFSVLFVYFSWVAFDKNRIGYFVLFGFVTALLINARIAGILGFGAAALLFLIHFIKAPANKRLGVFYCGLAYVLSTILFLYLSWPTLWLNPVKAFTHILRLSLNFTAFGGNTLFKGHSISTLNLPWDYLPHWIGITVPIFVLIIFVFGFIYGVYELVQSVRMKSSSLLSGQMFIWLICLVVPIFQVVALRAPIFDGWRHMFFIYLYFLLFSAVLVQRLWLMHHLWPKVVVLIGFLWTMGNNAYALFVNHPFQHIYFNEIVSRKPEYLRTHYELDYWGTSYRKAFEYLIELQPKDTIRYIAANPPGRYGTAILDENNRHRFKSVLSISKADYFISNYRWHQFEYPLRRKIYEYRVNNSTIIAIWKIDSADTSVNLHLIK